MDIFHTFHIVEREMGRNYNNLSFRNIGGELYSKKINKLFLESYIILEYEQMHNMEIMNSCHFKINL
jgi:hypothetical protein